MKPHHPKRSARRQRGQAMAEYSILSWILLLALVFVTSAPVFRIPVAPGIVRNRNLLEMMLEAYQYYYDSFFLVLSMPYP